MDHLNALFVFYGLPASLSSPGYSLPRQFVFVFVNLRSCLPPARPSPHRLCPYCPSLPLCPHASGLSHHGVFTFVTHPLGPFKVVIYSAAGRSRSGRRPLTASSFVLFCFCHNNQCCERGDSCHTALSATRRLRVVSLSPSIRRRVPNCDA